MANEATAGRCSSRRFQHQALGLVLAVALLLAAPVRCQVPEQGATNETFSVTNFQEFYRGLQKGNQNRLQIKANIQLTSTLFINSAVVAIEGIPLADGQYPTLDCVQAGTDYAFDVSTSAPVTISGLNIGGCVSGVMRFRGSTVMLSDIVFRNNESPNPGNALLLQSNATVVGTNLQFITDVGTGPTSSLVHLEQSTLVLTTSAISNCRFDGPLITSVGGTLQADALTIDELNRFQGTDVISLSGCGPGGAHTLTNSRISGITNISSVLRGIAGAGTYAGALPGASSPAVFSPLDPARWNGCRLTLSNTSITGVSTTSALVATQGYGVDADQLTLTGNSEAPGLPDGVNATLLDVEGGWLRLDRASITGNQIRGIALRVMAPAGPTAIRTGTIQDNAAQAILYVEGAQGFADGAAWEQATQQLPGLAFAARAAPLSRSRYQQVKAQIAALEAQRDASARGAPVLLASVDLVNNRISGSLLQGDGTGWDSGSAGLYKGLTWSIQGGSITGNTAQGALLETGATNLTLVGTRVASNSLGGPGVAVRGGVLRVEGVAAMENTLGARQLVYGESLGTSYVRASQFVSNTAVDAVLELRSVSYVALTSTVWAGNQVAGSVVTITESEVDIVDFDAHDNVAQAVLRLDVTPLSVRDASFVANSAAGLLALSSTPLYKGAPALLTNVSFLANLVNPQISGTMVLSAPNPAMPVNITSSRFIGNTIRKDLVANSTGGLFLSASTTSIPTTIANCTFDRNTGATGGALWTARSTVVDDCTFTNNVATYTGGGIYAEAGAPLVIPPTTLFRNNTAPSGGGLTCDECAPLTITSAAFIGNRADPSLEPVQAPITGAPDIPCGPGSGGAICLVTSSSKALITTTTFTNNTAELGGGLYLDNSCGEGASASAACNITLDRMGLDGNNASTPTYGDIYLTSDAGVQVCCTNAENKLQCEAAAKLQEVQCNVKGIGGLATSPVAIQVVSSNANSAVVSGSTLLSAVVSLVDEKGRVVSVAPGGLRVDISSNSKDLIVVGNTSVPFNNDPSINISNFQVLPNRSPDNSEYQILFKATGSAFAQKIVPGSFNITIPQCTLGEFETYFRCSECGQYKGQYSLYPKVRCEPCPPSGNCTGGYLVPRDGYWQPNPLVPQLQECPLDGGCSRAREKDTELFQFMQGLARTLGKRGGLDSVKANITTVERSFTAMQCGRGYKGRLCGVCAKGFGRWSTRCVECAARALNNFYLFLSLLFLVFIMSVTIASHLRAALYKRPPPPPPPQEEEAEALDKRKVYDLEQILADQARKKLDARLDADQVAARQKEEVAARQREEAATSADRSSLHFSMLTALAKIMVSYVQVIGMARALELNIPRPLRRFLSNFDYTSSLTWLSLDCSFHGSPFDKAVKRAIFTACLPLMLMAFFSTYWYFKYRQRRKAQERQAAASPSPFASSSANGTPAPAPAPTAPRSFLANRLMTTFLQVAFYTYPLVTATLFHLFDCRKLRTCSSAIECTYRNNNPTFWKSGWYWTQSYSTTCFKGAHLTVMLAVGIPAIVIFSIGVPLLFGFTIWARRSKLQQPRVLLRFGFLYWEYRQRCHYWEAIITARKLGLLMTTIFLRYTGKYAASIQIYTSLMVLLVAILLQEAFRPFESTRGDDLLNRMERLSLFASVATFVLMAYYLVGPISQGVRLALAAAIMGLNLACLLKFISLILWELWLWMLDKLGMEEPTAFHFTDIRQVSSRLRGRWKDIRSIIVNDFVMPSMVSRLSNRHGARNQLPAPVPTQEDVHP